MADFDHLEWFEAYSDIPNILAKIHTQIITILIKT